MGTILMSMGAAAGTVVAIDMFEKLSKVAGKEFQKIQKENEAKEIERLKKKLEKLENKTK